MNSANSPLLNRLVLVVLSLNLVCLILLVVRSYQKPLAALPAPALESPVDGANTAAAEPVSLPPPVLTPVSPRRVAPANPPPAETASASAGAGSLSASDGAFTASEPIAALPVPAPPPPLVNLGNTRGVSKAPVLATKSGPQLGLDGRPVPIGLAGRVTLLGKPKPEIPIEFGPSCGPLHPRVTTTRHFVVDSEGGLANVLVWLNDAGVAPPLVAPPVLDQTGCMFEPYVLGLVAGQKLRVQNSDPVWHNIHLTPKNSSERNFAQTVRGQINEVSFSVPELFIRIKCDIHPWMFAYVTVAPHPYFAVTDGNGFYQIPGGFPSGHYHVMAIHPRAGRVVKDLRGQGQELDLTDGGPQILNFQLQLPVEQQARR